MEVNVKGIGSHFSPRSVQFILGTKSDISPTLWLDFGCCDVPKGFWDHTAG